MKLSARSRVRRLPAVLIVVGLCVTLAVSGCGRRVNTRPASSLSSQDRDALNQYEQIRAALAADDLNSARLAANGLVKLLQPADAKAPAPAALAPAKSVATAPALDRARQLFKGLSAKMIPLADGVEGYYVLTSPLPSAGDWIQQKPDSDNPYLGRAMHEYGDLKK